MPCTAVSCTSQMNVHMVLHRTRDFGQDEVCVNQLGLPHYAPRGRDGLESRRAADTNEGRSCHSPAARSGREAAVRPWTPARSPDAFRLVGFTCGGGMLTEHRRPVE